MYSQQSISGHAHMSGAGRQHMLDLVHRHRVRVSERAHVIDL